MPIDLEMLSEGAEERAVYHNRLRRLKESPELVESYLQLLREVWDPVDDTWQQALPVIEEAGRHVVAQYENGRPFETLITPGCDILRENLPTIVSSVEAGKPLVFVPCLFFGSSMYLEFADLVVIGTGVGHGDAVARARTEAVARRLKAVADPTRLALLHSLASAPSSVGELAMLFRLTQPTVSMHVKVLRQSGLVRSERRGARMRLSADPAAVESLLDDLRHGRPSRPGRRQHDRQRPDAGDRGREHPLGRSGHGIGRESRQHLLEEDPRLQAGQAGAQAHVLAEAEGEMDRIGASAHLEARAASSPKIRSSRLADA